MTIHCGVTGSQLEVIENISFQDALWIQSGFSLNRQKGKAKKSNNRLSLDHFRYVVC